MSLRRSSERPVARSAGGPCREQPVRRRLELVGEETRDANGQAVPRGQNAGEGGRVRYIVYDPTGYMSVNLAWLKQPAIAGGKATDPQDALAAMGAYNSYGDRSRSTKPAASSRIRHSAR